MLTATVRHFKIMEDFLPKDYEIPVAQSNYMKFVKGDNRFRILGSSVVGFEYFTKDNKPIRSKEPFEDAYPHDMKDKGKVKAFWAFPVFNYETQSVQILELTQKTIMESIKSLVSNPKWGSPFMYDLNVKKTGEGMETSYSTQPEPPIGEPEDMVLNEYSEKPVNLEALFTGDDPFEKK